MSRRFSTGFATVLVVVGRVCDAGSRGSGGGEPAHRARHRQRDLSRCGARHHRQRCGASRPDFAGGGIRRGRRARLRRASLRTPFAIFCRRRRRRGPTCRRSSISPAARSSTLATITSCRSMLRSIAIPTCRSKRSACPISLTRSRDAGQARIVVLDAARANPYATQGSPLAPGLALVDPERGELIAFNAAPGTLAGDEEGPYGVYGKTLAGAIRQGGVDIVQAFDQTRVSVDAETQGACCRGAPRNLAVHFTSSNAPPTLLLRPSRSRRPSAGPSPASRPRTPTPPPSSATRSRAIGEFLAAYPHSDQARRVRAILAVRREASYWRRTVAPIRRARIGPICGPIGKAHTSLTRVAVSRCSRPSSSRRRIFGQRSS